MSWRSWGDYFNLLGELPLGVNVAGFVPHSALRAAVLGPERRSQPATPAERHRLTDALREALDEGAIGFSTSRGTNHTDATGSPVPSRFADDDELTALLSAGGDRIWQMNIRSKGDATEAGLRNALDELDRYASMTRQADWRLTWTPLVAGPGDTHVWRRLLESSEQHTDVAAPQTSPQPIQSAITFDGPSYAAMVDGWAPAFAGYGDLSDSDRMARLADRDFRDILKASPQNCARITAPCFDRWRVGSSTDADAIGLTLSQYAEQIDSDPVDAMLDLAIGDGLTTVIEAPLSNIDEEAVRALVTAPHTLFGIGDAGAHIKSITNYTYPTYVLARLTRDEAWFTIAEAVSELTRRPAEMFAFAGRGLLAPGYAADVCVIDLERLAVGPARVVADMPGGGKRLHRDATGYSAVVVNGTVTVENDQLTGASAGRLVRA
jgi:N-acyl-D-aspartate/D-glutamate deacylase